MNHSFTAKQRKVYEVLRAYIEEHGEAPMIEEFRDLLGVASIRTATQYLELLEKKGVIGRKRYQRRGIYLKDRDTAADTFLLPVVGSVGCDNLSVFSNPTWDEFLSVASDLVMGANKDRLVVVKAMGNSMEDAGIQDGNFVITEFGREINNGDLVVAVVDDMAVAKKIEISNNAVILYPVSQDPNYKPIILKRDLQKIGKIIDIIRVPKTSKIEVIPIKEDFV